MLHPNSKTIRSVISLQRAVNFNVIFKRGFLVLMLVSNSVIISGCSSLEPWVLPYEREILADPIMSFSRQPSIDSHFSHVYDVREGSHGAGTSVGGGCGCN